MSTCVTDSISLVSDSNNNTINTNSFKERPESEKNSDSDEYGNACALNDNSKPQQGTGEKRVAPQRSTPLIPPFVKDSRKLFVGGLPSDVTCDEFRSFFETYGKVLDSVVMYDRVTSNSRGFGFVTFEDEDASGQLLRMRRLEMRGKLVEIKPAEPKASVFPRTQPNAAVKMMHTGSHVLGSPSFPPMPMVSPSHFYHVATAIPYGTTLNEASPDEGILMGPSFLPVGHRFPVDVLPGDQSVSPTLCAAPTAVAVPVAYPTSFPLHSMTMPCSVDGNYYASTAPFDSYFNPDMMHSYIGYTGADATNCVDELPVCYNQYHQHFQASDDYRKYVERNPGKQVHAPE